MKWSLMLREGVMQINLEPENEHELKAFDILREHEGAATIHKGVNVQDCMGGYLRNFGEASTTLAITIRNRPTPEAKET